MSKFKVGDRVRYIEDGDEGLVTSINLRGWITVEFERDGDCNMLPEDLELVSGDAEEPPLAPWERDILARDAAIRQGMENLATLGDQLGINSVSSFEQNVRRITDQIADLLISKNKQYSNSALDPIRVFSKADRMEQLRVRADDKLSRIRNGDTSEDAVLDLCGYLILMKIAGESE